MISKALFGMSALLSAGLVSTYDMPNSEIAPAAVVEARFPTAEERFDRPDRLLLSPVTLLQQVPSNLAPAAAAPKRDRLPAPPADCGKQEWPYLSAECLISVDADSLRRKVRMITIERRYGENTSMLAGVSPVEIASR
jgi:hypothetical protein